MNNANLAQLDRAGFVKTQVIGSSPIVEAYKEDYGNQSMVQ